MKIIRDRDETIVFIRTNPIMEKCSWFDVYNGGELKREDLLKGNWNKESDLIESETRRIIHETKMIGRLRGLVLILIVAAIATMAYVYAS